MMHKPSEADILKVAKEVAEQVYGMIALPYTARLTSTDIMSPLGAQ